MTETVRSDLSNDQRILYEYVIGVDAGVVPIPWANRKIGPLCHSRWLTLAIRILCLYTRTASPSSNLTLLANFIAKVYAPTWFSIKQSSKLKDMPQILWEYIQKLDDLVDDRVANIVKPCLQKKCLFPVI